MPDLGDRLGSALKRLGDPPDTAGVYERVARKRRRRGRRVRIQSFSLIAVVLLGTGIAVYMLHRAFAGNETRPAASNAESAIYFSAALPPDKSRQIYTMEPDGSGIRQLTRGSLESFDPDRSPDGSRIAFTGQPFEEAHPGGGVFSEGGVDLYVMNAEGTDVRRITDSPFSQRSARWVSNDRLVYEAETNDSIDIWTIHADGTNRRRLTGDRNDEENTQPAVSPDGAWVAYISRAGPLPGAGIAAVSTDGTREGWIVPPRPGEDAGFPSWSPDGTRIAYIARAGAPGSNDAVMVVDLPSGNSTRVTSDFQVPSDVSWSPDGVHLLVAANSDKDVNDFYLVKPDGTGLRKLTDLGIPYPVGPDLLSANWEPAAGTVAPVVPNPITKAFDILKEPDSNAPPPGRATGLTGEVLVDVWSQGFEDSDIYVMNADGSNLRPLIATPDRESDGRWSPDGTKVVFHRTPAPEVRPDGTSVFKAGNAQILVANADGSGARELASGNIPGSAVWSPDGSGIAYVAGDRDGWNLRIVNIDGTNPRQITDGFTVNAPSWSQDGTHFTFAADAYAKGSPEKEVGMEVYRMNADGSSLTRLTNNYVYDQYPFWSPDGLTIAFARSVTNSDEQWDLYVMNADGSAERQLTSWPGQEGPFVWSPDGSMLMFSNKKRDGDASAEIYVVSPAEGSAALVMEGRFTEVTPTDWRTAE